MNLYESQVHPGLLNSRIDDTRKAELVSYYFGYRGAALAQRLVDDVESVYSLNSRTLRNLDAHFYRNLQEKYGLEGPKHTQSVFLKQLKHANEVPMYIVKNALPRGMENVYGLRNLVDLPCDSPSELLAQALASNDPVEAYETQRMLLLAEVSLHIHMRTMHEQPYQQLRDIHKLLCREFYVPEQRGVSNTSHVAINAVHDNVTNEYLGRADVRNFNDDHIKQHVFQGRRYSGFDGDTYNALTQIRKKTDKVAIMKGTDKSRNKTSINLNEAVTDCQGMIIAALGNERRPSTPQMRAEVAGRVLSIIQNYYRDAVEIKSDPGVGSRSSSGGRNWERYQVFIEGKTMPLEMIFVDEKGMIDSSVKVGDLNNPDEIDRAHSIYEIQRAQRMFPIIFPHEVYNGSTYEEVNRQLPDLMATKLQNEAEQLLERDRCTYKEEWFDGETTY